MEFTIYENYKTLENMTIKFNLINLCYFLSIMQSDFRDF